MFLSQGANKWTRNHFFCISSVSEEKTETYWNWEFDLKFSCAHWGLKSPNMETFLRALPRALRLTLTKLLPLSCFLLVPPGVGWQGQRILLSKFRILAAAKWPKTFCPRNFPSLRCCLETCKHQEQLFHTLVWPMGRNDQQKKCSFYCLIITLSFINWRSSAGQLLNFIIWWLTFLFPFGDHWSSTKGSSISENGLLMFLFGKIKYVGKKCSKRRHAV